MTENEELDALTLATTTLQKIARESDNETVQLMASVAGITCLLMLEQVPEHVLTALPIGLESCIERHKWMMQNMQAEKQAKEQAKEQVNE